MRPSDGERRDPLAGTPLPWDEGGEPVEELGMVHSRGRGAAAVARRPGGKRGALRPSERRRRRRQLSVTFSDPEVPERLRRLAQRWGLSGPDGRSPNTSAVVEHLLLSQLEAAERGEIGPPEGAPGS